MKVTFNFNRMKYRQRVYISVEIKRKSAYLKAFCFQVPPVIGNFSGPCKWREVRIWLNYINSYPLYPKTELSFKPISYEFICIKVILIKTECNSWWHDAEVRSLKYYSSDINWLRFSVYLDLEVSSPYVYGFIIYCFIIYCFPSYNPFIISPVSCQFFETALNIYVTYDSAAVVFIFCLALQIQKYISETASISILRERVGNSRSDPKEIHIFSRWTQNKYECK
jgi:hypothetical protein